MLMKFAHFVVLMKKRLPFYCDCTIINKFGVDLSFYIFNSTNMTYSLILKDIFFLLQNPKSLSLECYSFLYLQSVESKSAKAIVC